MASFVTTLMRKERCGSDVVLGQIARPDGYEYRAGQWFRLRLETDEGEQARTFSIASAPADPCIEFATRLSGSAFKRALGAMPEGSSVVISGPGGGFGVPPGVTRVLFLVGGVGVTPVRSILRDRIQRALPLEECVVIFGNRDASCVPYGDELAAMGDAGVRLVLAYEAAGEDWDGERGFVTAEMVRRHADVTAGWHCVLSGPPAMVEAMERVLDELGVDRERRSVESFGPRAGGRPTAPSVRRG